MSASRVSSVILSFALTWAHSAAAADFACPANYVLIIPANQALSPFCVAKYEMKNVQGAPLPAPNDTPWVNISRAQAENACVSIGVGADLISNLQWQEVAHQIELNKLNWSNDNGGQGSLNVGVVANAGGAPLPASANDEEACAGTGSVCNSTSWSLQKRTHNLPYGTIWDFSGNASEWIKDDSPAYGFSGSAAEPLVRRDSLLLDNFGTQIDLTGSSSLDALQVGYIFLTWDGGALVRGSSFVDSLKYAGIYYADGTLTSDQALSFVGFRCAMPAVPNSATATSTETATSTATATTTTAGTSTTTVTNTGTSTQTGTSTNSFTATNTTTLTNTATSTASQTRTSTKTVILPAPAPIIWNWGIWLVNWWPWNQMLKPAFEAPKPAVIVPKVASKPPAVVPKKPMTDPRAHLKRR